MKILDLVTAWAAVTRLRPCKNSRLYPPSEAWRSALWAEIVQIVESSTQGRFGDPEANYAYNLRGLVASVQEAQAAGKGVRDAEREICDWAYRTREIRDSWAREDLRY